MPSLVGKHVLVIGGSSGIGFGVARAALAEGARITIASSSETKLSAAVTRLNGGDAVHAVVLDVGQESDVKAFFDKIDTVDHLVFSAGGAISKDSSSLEFSAIKEVLNVRYYGVLFCARYGKDHITDSFTVTSGTTAVRPIPGISNFVGGAGALISAARGLALDLAPVRVNCIAPGIVLTEMWEIMPSGMRDGFLKSTAEKIPVGHMGTPEEVAEAYLFAMKCSYFTGQTIIVDGGSTLV